MGALATIPLVIGLVNMDAGLMLDVGLILPLVLRRRATVAAFTAICLLLLLPAVSTNHDRRKAVGLR